MDSTDVTGPRLKGVIPPLVTPLQAGGALDIGGLERLVAHMITGGVDALFALGSTGEGPSLGSTMQRELVSRVCGLCASRLPVLVGVSHTALEESVSLARYAADCGAAGVVATTPFYFPPEQSDLDRYFRELAAAVPIPLFLYNMPGLTGTVIEVETVRGLMDCDRIAGIKDSSGDLHYFKSLCTMKQARRDWAVFMGREELGVSAARCGSHGVVPGGANLAPALHAALWTAVSEGDWHRAEECQSRINQIGQSIYNLGGSGVGFIQGLKAALALAGLCDDRLALPFSPLPGNDREELERRLQAIGFPDQ